MTDIEKEATVDTNTAAGVDPGLKDAYLKEQIRLNGQLRRENRQLEESVRFFETVLLPAILQSNGTLVIPRALIRRPGGGKILLEYNSSRDIVIKLQ